MPKNSNELPFGEWIHVNHFPPGTTSEEVSSWLHEVVGVYIPPANIAVRDTHRGDEARAVISFTKETLEPIMEWLLQGREFNGVAPVVSKLWEQKHLRRGNVRQRL